MIFEGRSQRCCGIISVALDIRNSLLPDNFLIVRSLARYRAKIRIASKFTDLTTAPFFRRFKFSKRIKKKIASDVSLLNKTTLPPLVFCPPVPVKRKRNEQVTILRVRCTRTNLPDNEIGTRSVNLSRYEPSLFRLARWCTVAN